MGKKREVPQALAEQAYRLSKIRLLAQEPFDADRLGLYAQLWHETLLPCAACLYLFDEERKLSGVRVLYSGRKWAARRYCEDLPAIFAEGGAAMIGVSMTAEEPQATGQDITELSRVALYCERERIPVLEMILLDESGYIPLYRAGGEVPPRYEEKMQK